MTDPSPSAPSVDGVQPPPAAQDGASPGVPPKDTGVPPGKSDAVLRKRMRFLLLFLVGTPYALYLLWCFFLLSFLPRPTGEMQALVSFGKLTAFIGIAVFLGIGAFGFFRIGTAQNVPDAVRKWGLVRLSLFVLPPMLVSLVVPFLIGREPALRIAIIEPTRVEDFVAPLSITFSLEDALGVLEKLGLKPVSFAWDFNGDGKQDEETVVARATAFYDKQGAYDVVARIRLSDKSERRLIRRFVIPKAVFSVTPPKPVVDEPVRFSIEHLVDDVKTIREVQWDLDADGEADVTTTDPSIAHTFLRTGSVKISAVVLLENQTQTVYERTVEIFAPEPLPFPVEVITEPKRLLGPAPLGVSFQIETAEPVKDIVWDFGDGQNATGDRAAHTFVDRGVYPVAVSVRSQSDVIAKIVKVVRVVDELRISDLSFDGSVPVDSSGKLEAEVPVNLTLTPRTSMPLIEFFWEAPNATEVGSEEGSLQAVYRRPGTFIITLIAQSPDGKAMRKPLTLNVLPASSMVSIKVTPEGGVAPLLVRFDGSETVIPGKEITGFEWFIGQDSVPRQGGAQMEYLFEQPGTYEVRLVTYTTTGETFETTKTIVIRKPVLDACILASRTEGPAPLGVTFESCSAGGMTSFEWDFGDGARTDEENPVHVFEEAGVYTITLTVRDDLGSIDRATVTITARE